MVAPLFQESINPTDYADLLEVRIRLFLSAFDRLDMATRTSIYATPRWVTSYNFMCLLNIPNIVRRFGPFRNLYEGKYCGESFNRVLKPMANRGSHRNRCFNLMRNLVREKAMSAIQENFEKHLHGSLGNQPPTQDTSRSSIYRMAHRYQSRRTLFSHYNKNLPLSLLVFNENGERCYGICYIFDNKQFLCPMARNFETEIIVGGVMRYWFWNLSLPLSESRTLESITPIDYAILLPLTHDPSRPDWIPPANYYTITSYVWNSEEAIVGF
jgi:hypothetical protein